MELLFEQLSCKIASFPEESAITLSDFNKAILPTAIFPRRQKKTTILIPHRMHWAVVQQARKTYQTNQIVVHSIENPLFSRDSEALLTHAKPTTFFTVRRFCCCFDSSCGELLVFLYAMPPPSYSLGLRGPHLRVVVVASGKLQFHAVRSIVGANVCARGFRGASSDRRKIFGSKGKGCVTLACVVRQ